MNLLYKHTLFFTNRTQLTKIIYNFIARNSFQIDPNSRSINNISFQEIATDLGFSPKIFEINFSNHFLEPIKSSKDFLNPLLTNNIEEVFREYSETLKNYNGFIIIENYWERFQKFLKVNNVEKDSLTALIERILRKEIFLSTPKELRQGEILSIEFEETNPEEHALYRDCLGYNTAQRSRVEKVLKDLDKKLSFLRNCLNELREIINQIMIVSNHCVHKDDYSSVDIISDQKLTLSTGIFSQNLGRELYVLDTPHNFIHPYGVSEILDALKRQVYIQDIREISTNFIFRACIHLCVAVIIGDCGYALLGAFLSLVLFRFNYIGRYLAFFILELTVSTMLTGFFIYEEFFGYHLHLGFFGVNKISDAASIVKSILVIGALLLLTASSLGIINGALTENKRHAIEQATKVGFVIFSSLFVFVRREESVDPFTRYFLLFLAILCLLIIVYYNGVLIIVKIPSFFLDYISFSRIVLLSMIKASMILSVNQFLGPTNTSNPFYLFLWIIFHLILFSWGCLTVFCVSLRFIIIELSPRSCSKKAIPITFFQSSNSAYLEGVEWL